MKSIRLVFHNKTSATVGNGMDLYRLAIPYAFVGEEVDQVKSMGLDEFDTTPCDADVYVMNRPMSYRAKKVKDAGKFLIVDVDDYWVTPKWHWLYPDNLKRYIAHCETLPLDENDKRELKNIKHVYEREKVQAQNTIDSCHMADIVTCTTETLRREFARIGITAHIIKNSIHSNVNMFTTEKQKSNWLRFGWIGGNYHGKDITLMYPGFRMLHKDIELSDEFQILSAFNNNSEYREIEKIMSNNFAGCSPEYVHYLHKYTRVGSHMGADEPYRRIWNMSPTEYGMMYEHLDVALIPLRDNKFNSCKSELKLIEAGMTGCAAIVSNVEPFKTYLKHGFNCLVTNGENGWYTAIRRLILDRELVATLAKNLHQTIIENFDTITEANKLKQLIA